MTDRYRVDVAKAALLISTSLVLSLPKAVVPEIGNLIDGQNTLNPSPPPNDHARVYRGSLLSLDARI